MGRRTRVALLVCSIVGMGGGIAAADVPWAKRCTEETVDLSVFRKLRCVGGAELRTRGYLDPTTVAEAELIAPACMMVTPVAGMIYANRWVCGGRGGGGIEAIQQARVIAAMGKASGGVHPSVQWEVQTRLERGTRGYADVVHYDPAKAPDVMQVWELKRWDARGGWEDQVEDYRQALDDATRDGVAVVRGTALAQFADTWLVAEEVQRPGCAKVPFRTFVGWQAAPGLYATYEYATCFDPQTEPVPLPDPRWVPNGAPQPRPGTRATPYPGTKYPPVPAPRPVPVPARGYDWSLECNAGFLQVCNFGPFRLPNLNPYSGMVYGDPHLATFDGLKFDLQAVGELELVTSERHGVAVQARFVPVGASRTVSILDAVALRLRGHVVELRADATPALRVDGEPVELRDAMMLDLGGGAAIAHAGGAYLAIWPGDGERPALLVDRGTGALRMSIPRDPDAVGLLGNADGNPDNDLATAWGERLPTATSAATLHGAFADSWRLAADHAMFTYGPGESTATFTDPTFPDSHVTVADLTPAEREAATRRCAAAGVIEGPQFDDCVLDAALTLDASFVAAAAQVTRPLTVGGAAELDASGALVQTFEGAVAPNFDATRFATDPALGTFAGPLGKDDPYRFFIGEAPPNDAATVELDLIAIGDWSRGPAPVFTLRVNGSDVWSGTLAGRPPASTGRLAGGEPYAVHRLALTFPHGDRYVNAGLSVQGLAGAARQAFAVDNLRVAVRIVRPETFALALPATVEPGAPAAGAGRLESLGAQDRYAFTLAAPAHLVVTLARCTPQLAPTWTIAGADGVIVARGAGCWVGDTPRLAAGTWTLVVEGMAAGTYALEVAPRARPQTWTIALPASIAPGAPAGAGAIESPGAEDRYAIALAAPARLQLDFGDCTGDLITLEWQVLGPGRTVVASGLTGCTQSVRTPVIAAGSYCLIVTEPRSQGTYALAIAPEVAPQVFAVTLPAAIRDGAPAGAGRLETTSSRDHYTFTLAAPGRVQLELGDCTDQLYSIHWTLVPAGGGPVLASGQSCTPARSTSLPAGAYRLELHDNGHTGTYALAIAVRPPAQRFDVTLPLSVRDGVPARGAGVLEDEAAEDDYAFTLAAPGTLELVFSACEAMSWIEWTLVDERTGETLDQGGYCGPPPPTPLEAGRYRLTVTRDRGRSGTYRLDARVRSRTGP